MYRTVRGILFRLKAGISNLGPPSLRKSCVFVSLKICQVLLVSKYTLKLAYLKILKLMGI